jgi:hypothetical protein
MHEKASIRYTGNLILKTAIKIIEDNHAQFFVGKSMYFRHRGRIMKRFYLDIVKHV